MFLKRLFCCSAALCLLALAGCGATDYIKTDNSTELVISLPVSATGGEGPDGMLSDASQGTSSYELTEEDKKLIGVWRLNEVVIGGKETVFPNSYYIFNADGSFLLIVQSNTTYGWFKTSNGQLELAESTVSYRVEGNRLTFVTESGKVHNLTFVGK